MDMREHDVYILPLSPSPVHELRFVSCEDKRYLACLLMERIVRHGAFVSLYLRLRTTVGHDGAWESMTETAIVLIRAARTWCTKEFPRIS